MSPKFQSQRFIRMICDTLRIVVCWKECTLPENNRGCIPLPCKNILHKHSKHHCGSPKGGIHWNIYPTNRLHGDYLSRRNT